MPPRAAAITCATGTITLYGDKYDAFYTNNANWNTRRDSLGGGGIITLRPAHWLNQVLEPPLPDAPSGAGEKELSYAAWEYMHLGAIAEWAEIEILTGSMFFSLKLEFFAKLLSAADNAGTLPAGKHTISEVTQLLVEVLRALAVALKTIRRADIIYHCTTTPGAETVFDYFTIERMQYADTTNGCLLRQLRNLQQHCWVAADRDDADGIFQSVHRTLGPVLLHDKPARDRAPAVLEHWASTMVSPDLEEFAPANGLLHEVARRCASTEEARFRPLYMRSFARAYPAQAAAFKGGAAGNGQITGYTAWQRAKALMLVLGVGDEFVEATAAALESLVFDLAAGLETDTLRTASWQVRMQQLAADHRNQQRAPSERASEGSLELFKISSFKKLDDIVSSLPANDNVKVIEELMPHDCAAGILFLNGLLKIKRPAWSAISAAVFGGPQGNALALHAAAEKALAVDVAGSSIPDGASVLARETVLKLGKGKLRVASSNALPGKLPTDSIDYWHEICAPTIRRREGAWRLHTLPTLRSPLHMFTSPDHLRLAEWPVETALGVVGFKDKGRNSLHAALSNVCKMAVTILAFPDNIAQKGYLLNQLMNCVQLIFSDVSDAIATMFATPAQNAVRVTTFLLSKGDGARAWTQLKGDLKAVVDLLEAAARGQDPNAKLQLTADLSRMTLSGTDAAVTGDATNLQEQTTGGKAIVRWQPPGGGGISNDTRRRWPKGVYKFWGDAAIREGVYSTDAGLLFGTTLVSPAEGAKALPDDKSLVCLAQVAPGPCSASRSKWCVNPLLCRGYGAHAWTEAMNKNFGKRSETFVYTEGYQRPDNAVALVEPQWQQGAAPDVPWRVPDIAWDRDTGDVNKRARDEKQDDGAAKGRGGRGRGDGGGKGAASGKGGAKGGRKSRGKGRGGKPPFGRRGRGN